VEGNEDRLGEKEVVLMMVMMVSRIVDANVNR